ncbi:MAG: hypothetical protein WA793_11860 [Sphingorhabdus sp.]|uniref:hypothetical protein n=1 Tax=Sphingorhabdus sp. TaxID=1902408 RepID=UPI003CBD01A0
MRAGIAPRLLLLGSALAVLAVATPLVAAGCFVPVVLTYLAVGERSLLVTFLRPLAILVLASAALWIFVYLDFDQPQLVVAIAHLTAPDAPFGLMVRMVCASLMVALAIGSVPDGGDLALARRFGLSDSHAVLYAGGRSGIMVVSDGIAKSLMTLRAHGMIGLGRLDWLRHLPIILGQTWGACLHLLAARGEIKWEGNGFLHNGAPVFERCFATSHRDDSACHLCWIAVIVAVIGGVLWR